MRYAVALDIGGTKIEAVLFNEKYRQIRKNRYYFAKTKTQRIVRIERGELLKLICNAIDFAKQGYSIEGIGIGLPDIVTLDGAIKGPTRLIALSDFPLAKYLKKRYGCRVEIANDADCFVLAEQSLGAAKGHKNVFGLIYGTGIGGGLVIDGKLHRPRESAGELGHNVVDPSGPRERLGIKGTVESFAGGPELIKQYYRFGGKMKDADPASISRSREPAARKALSISMEHLAMGIGHVMNLINPSVIVVGGGQSNMDIYGRLTKLTRKYVHPGLRENIRIVKNRLGDSAGVYGAAALVLER